MSLFLLIRHAHTDTLGRRLVGRRPGMELSETGRQQARALGMRLAEQPLAAIYSSPLERTIQTAVAIAERRDLEVQVRRELIEVDVGDWTGRDFDDLREDPLYVRFNRLRGTTPIPGGELVSEIQSRMISFLEGLRADGPDRPVAIVSHGDCIRCAVAGYLGLALDLIPRLQIDPASITVLRADDWGSQLLRLNDTGNLNF
jgi:probable phosphomutase (TIGR03848 family)